MAVWNRTQHRNTWAKRGKTFTLRRWEKWCCWTTSSKKGALVAGLCVECHGKRRFWVPFAWFLMERRPCVHFRLSKLCSDSSFKSFAIAAQSFPRALVNRMLLSSVHSESARIDLSCQPSTSLVLPLSGIESDPQSRVKRFPRLRTAVLTDMHSGSAWYFLKLVRVSFVKGLALCWRTFP